MNGNKIDRIKELIQILNEAGRAYYQEATEIMSNYEYDALYDELLQLEKETKVVLGNSPTVNVGYEVMSELPKERHEKPMLSLNKTKSVEELADWIGNQETLLSWKLDGLTIVLTYNQGELQKAVTRGNGEIGEVITNNAKVFKNVPLKITYTGELILRGEAVISYSDFENINNLIEDVDAKYKNPRNLCSGSVRQLNNQITASRNVKFYAFSLVKADGINFYNSRKFQYEWLKEQGFDVVEYKVVTRETLPETMSYFSEKIQKYEVPSDGLVAVYDNIAYGQGLGATSKFPRDSMAFKWADEVKETKLLEIEWSPSRTGLINPVAIFEPVELEGTSVSRASVHNISILKGLELGQGDIIKVYKANMIIPQIADNLTRSGASGIPEVCPVCSQRTNIRKINDVEALYCENPECLAKKIKAFTLFVSRDALNIDGLSEASLEKFIAKGFIKEFSDIFKLNQYKEEIIQMEGFGPKSYDNLMSSLEKARQTTLPKLIYSLGILNIGLSNAKIICKEFDYDIGRLMHATREELALIGGIGGVIADSLVSYFEKESNVENLEHLLEELVLEKIEINESNLALKDKIFVITGSLNHYENRNELKSFIEEKGGKVTGSVTSKTNYLINNDTMSMSSKNKKAKELGVEIISEEDFMNLI
ncbi:DNA ligase (NAD+) [Lachnotalea glycerini]|uniref:DNA ligase n=1 Tax=Lachnotalea glycerini TaxID=1763509 RepID=A0A318EL36_9FIRM|nr:NAD-dependent DNA ligase LigA [Lachnotalea glycerini]PXV89388.1 DNA ligase (NAD+) [Lachnotalea glycerini]